MKQPSYLIDVKTIKSVHLTFTGNIGTGETGPSKPVACARLFIGIGNGLLQICWSSFRLQQRQSRRSLTHTRGEVVMLHETAMVGKFQVVKSCIVWHFIIVSTAEICTLFPFRRCCCCSVALHINNHEGNTEEFYSHNVVIIHAISVDVLIQHIALKYCQCIHSVHNLACVPQPARPSGTQTPECNAMLCSTTTISQTTKSLGPCSVSLPLSRLPSAFHNNNSIAAASPRPSLHIPTCLPRWLQCPPC